MYNIVLDQGLQYSLLQYSVDTLGNHISIKI